MKNNNLLTRALALVGTVLVLLPLLAPVFFGFVSLAVDGIYRFDYLMPAELALVALAGGLLLIWAALRAHTRRRLIGWTFGLAVALLVGAQALAVVSGLANGDREPAGFWWLVVIAALAGYVVALAAMDVGGLLLLRDLFRGRRPAL